MEQVIVLLVVAGAAFYVVRSLRRGMKNHAEGTGCCGKCGKKDTP